MSDNNSPEMVTSEEEKTLEEKVQDYKEKYEPTPVDDSSSKIIQIVTGAEGIPSIKYNGDTLTVAEVIGILDMSKDILMRKTIGTTLLQQNMYNMLQGLK